MGLGKLWVVASLGYPQSSSLSGRNSLATLCTQTHRHPLLLATSSTSSLNSERNPVRCGGDCSHSKLVARSWFSKCIPIPASGSTHLSRVSCLNSRKFLSSTIPFATCPQIAPSECSQPGPPSLQRAKTPRTELKYQFLSVSSLLPGMRS